MLIDIITANKSMPNVNMQLWREFWTNEIWLWAELHFLKWKQTEQLNISVFEFFEY